jgi:hypothetical protein
MPDLREDLGRLADFVGEPATLHDLETARRRRERRRRTSGLVAGLAVMVAAGVFLATTLRDRPVPTPGDPGPATTGSATTVWPENAVNGASADDVQAALDDGDDSLRWRTDPQKVVERFGQQILGRSVLIVARPTQVGDGLVVEAWPCPPGEVPIGLSCDAPQGDPLSFRLIQGARQGDGGIWSVESVTSVPLEVSLGSAASESIAEGSDVMFEISQLDPSTSAHVGIVASNGCDVVHATDDLPNGQSVLRVPKLDQSSPECAASPGGYAYAYVTDDTTLPSVDPINEPTAIEYPWITILPIAISPEAGTSESETAAAPTELEVVCDDDSTLVPGSGTVAAQADGVHLAVVNKGTLDTQFNIADGAKNVDLASGNQKRLVQPLDPGRHFVLCSVEGGSFTQSIEVVDPNGYWFDPDPDCSADQSNAADFNASAIATDGDPNDELQAWAASTFGSDMGPGVSALEGDYTVRPGAYPEQADDRAVVAVDAEGHVIGVVWFQGSGSNWIASSYVTCDTNAVF